MEYYAIATGQGTMVMNDFTRAHFKDFLKKNAGQRVEITPLLPESKKQRAFFEGAVVPLACYFHEKLDHRKWQDCVTMRDLLKIEFNGELIPFNGKIVKVAKSTKGELAGFIDRVIDDLEEQNGIDRSKLLDPEKYKHWRDVIFPAGDETAPDNYIDYLISVGLLK